MKELDLILQRWLARRYADSSAHEKRLFTELLELPDPQMAEYLLGTSRPPEPALAALIDQLAARE